MNSKVLVSGVNPGASVADPLTTRYSSIHDVSRSVRKKENTPSSKLSRQVPTTQPFAARISVRIRSGPDRRPIFDPLMSPRPCPEPAPKRPTGSESGAIPLKMPPHTPQQRPNRPSRWSPPCRFKTSDWCSATFERGIGTRGWCIPRTRYGQGSLWVSFPFSTPLPAPKNATKNTKVKRKKRMNDLAHLLSNTWPCTAAPLGKSLCAQCSTDCRPRSPARSPRSQAHPRTGGPSKPRS